MIISQTGINLIKKFEGLHKVGTGGKIHAYLCPANVWTIGWGHTRGVTANTTITKAQAEEFLKEDLNEVVKQVDAAVNVPLSQSQMDALVSFVFNLGIGAFRKSTLLKKLNKGDYAAVPAEFLKWNKARVKGKLVPLAGLTKRRSAEAALFAYEADTGDVEPQPQAVEAAPVTPLTQSKTLGGAAAATVGTVGTVAIGPLISEGANQLQPYTESHQYIAYAFVALTLIGIGIIVYSKLKSYHKETS